MENKIQICALDLSKEDIAILQDGSFQIYNGSAGTRINTSGYVDCLLNHNYPTNLHEYDVLIINLIHRITKPYKEEEHTRIHVSELEEHKFGVNEPTTLFDPRPYSLSLLKDNINALIQKQCLIIVFAENAYEIEYKVKKNNGYSTKFTSKPNISNYSFLHEPYLEFTKNGKKTNIVVKDELFRKLLEDFTEGIEYHQTFEQKMIWDGSKTIKDPNYCVLIENTIGEIISYANFKEKNALFVFPDIKNKGKFLKRFLSEIAPSIFPELFPNSKFNWLTESIYWVPNHSILQDNRKKEIDDHQKRLTEIDNSIQKNLESFAFLHNLITETGDELVKSVYKFLIWLGFSNVKEMDEHQQNGVLEEDIQIQIEDKLLVIEVKGIAGTSKDSECSQIAKIRLRRMKELNSTNVFALYIVNHERFKPPTSRNNPPFNEIQIQDAENDDRGLLTTWELFKIYFYITEGIFSKEEIRDYFLHYGLIEFKSLLTEIGKIDKIYKDGLIASLELQGIEVYIGDDIIGDKNGFLTRYRVISIEQEKQNITSAKNGRVGLKLDKAIKPHTCILKKI